MRRRLLIAAVSFLAMEPLTYAAHRWLMHGIGWVLHRSHHRARAAAWEANDAFPVLFASATILAMAAGTRHSRLRPLRAVGAGVSAYGAAYGFVHDLYVHARLGPLPTNQVLERLKDAHRVHHAFGGEPYGMLFPVVPAPLRARAAELEARLVRDQERPDRLDRGARSGRGRPSAA